MLYVADHQHHGMVQCPHHN